MCSGPEQCNYLTPYSYLSKKSSKNEMDRNNNSVTSNSGGESRILNSHNTYRPANNYTIYTKPVKLAISVFYDINSRLCIMVVVQ